MPYPEGMSLEFSWSPSLGRFHVTVVVDDHDILCCYSERLSDALADMAEEVRNRYEVGS